MIEDEIIMDYAKYCPHREDFPPQIKIRDRKERNFLKDKFFARKNQFNGIPGYFVCQLHNGKTIVKQSSPDYRESCNVICGKPGIEPEMLIVDMKELYSQKIAEATFIFRYEIKASDIFGKKETIEYVEKNIDIKIDFIPENSYKEFCQAIDMEPELNAELSIDEVEKLHIEKLTKASLVFYYEVKDSYIYGGKGTTGYAEQKYGLPVVLEANTFEHIDLLEMTKSAIKGFSKLCKVSAENIRIVSRREYEDKIEDNENSGDISLTLG